MAKEAIYGPAGDRAWMHPQNLRHLGAGQYLRAGDLARHNAHAGPGDRIRFCSSDMSASSGIAVTVQVVGRDLAELCDLTRHVAKTAVRSRPNGGVRSAEMGLDPPQLAMQAPEGCRESA
jgi:hypothetical protein